MEAVPTVDDSTSERARHRSWARLLKRVFEVDPLLCPQCQVEMKFEAVRGSGGTARLVLLPFEDHGYRATESIEHVLGERLRWFDIYVKGGGI